MAVKPNTTPEGEIACASGTPWQSDHTHCCQARLERDIPRCGGYATLVDQLCPGCPDCWPEWQTTEVQ